MMFEKHVDRLTSGINDYSRRKTTFLERMRPAHSRTYSTGNRPAVFSPGVLALGVISLILGGCGPLSDSRTIYVEGPEPEPVYQVSAKMDTLILSDLVRYYLDGDMEYDRGISSCYRDRCNQSDGDRIVFATIDYFVFAGFDDEYITAREDSIEDRNGILIGDVSFANKELPDIPGVAIDRSIIGYGGWGKYVGFDALYYDYIRNNRTQRMVEASLGGFSSRGNPESTTFEWTGAAVGLDHSVISEHRVLTGNSKIRLRSLPSSDLVFVDVNITDMTDINTNRVYDDLTWSNIILQDGVFETFEIKGQFFGPEHEEVGGVFEKNKVMGAFGASRVE